jgi:hypothetical protein
MYLYDVKIGTRPPMMIFLILAPYGVFALLMLAGSATTSLFTAAAICLLVMAYDAYRGRSIKVLGAGSALVFAALGGYLAVTGEAWSVSAVKFTADAGILAIALISIAAGKPFTLQYARETEDAQTAQMPDFLFANYVITWAWVLAILLMMGANMLPVYVPGMPLWSGLAVAFAARNTAVYFSRWYPGYWKAKLAATAMASSPS